MTRLIALPFRVLRPDADTDFLAFSLPDAITTSLTGTRNLLVRSSAAAARFDPQAPDLRRLAADADVDVALMGTILRAGPQLRATAQLVEAPAGTVVWSHASQHPLHDVFALQDELVGGIVSSLSRSLGEPGSRRRSDATCRGTPPPTSSTCAATSWRATGIGSPRRATSTCAAPSSISGFAPAWAGLGRCQRVLGKYFDLADGAEQAERAFKRALSAQSRPAGAAQVLRAARVRCRPRRGRHAPPAAPRPAWQRPRALRRPGARVPLRRPARCVGGGARGSATPRPDTSRPACSTPMRRSATTSASCATRTCATATSAALALFRAGRRGEALAAWAGPAPTPRRCSRRGAT